MFGTIFMSHGVQFYSGSYSSELSFRNKLGRLLWGLVWATVFRCDYGGHGEGTDKR